MAHRKHGFKYDHLREEARRPVSGRSMPGGTMPPGARRPGPRSKARRWADRLTALGLIVSEQGDQMTLTSYATHGLQVTAERTRRGRGWRWQITVRHPDIERRMRFEPEDRMTRAKKLVVGEDLLTGDADFDAGVHVSGPELEVMARLTYPLRRVVKALMITGRVAGGAIDWAQDGDEARPADLPDQLKELSALALRLSAPIDAIPRLRRRLLRDPDPGHRARVLTLLSSRGLEIEPRIQQRLLRDQAPVVRFKAAFIFDDAETLSALAADPEAGLPMRTEAVERLGQIADATTATGVDAAAGAVDDAVVTQALLAVIERYPEFIAALGEPAALIVLEHGPRSTHGEAIDRLGEVGTERAVAPLVEVADAFFRWRTMKDRARAAAHRITARLGGLRQGGLSVVQSADGGLSLDDLG